MFRLVNREILDRLKVVRSQETLLVFNENIDIAAAHISVSVYGLLIHLLGLVCAYATSFLAWLFRFFVLS